MKELHATGKGQGSVVDYTRWMTIVFHHLMKMGVGCLCGKNDIEKEIEYTRQRPVYL